MNSYHRFNRQFLACVFGSAAVAVSINYAVDPYNVFQTSFLKRQYEINERFTKIEFLKNNHARFDSYILGSSRAAFTAPATAGKYLPGSRFYNLAATLATQQDHLRHLEYFLKNRYRIRNIYMQIDIDVLSIHIGETEYGRLLHPDVSGRNRYLEYVRYLTIFPYKHLIAKLKLNLGAAPHAVDAHQNYDLRNTGTLFFPQLEAQMLKDHDAYIRNQPTFHQISPRGQYTSPKTNLEALRQFKALCSEHNIHCIFFTTPYHHMMMDSLNLQAYYESLAEISRITDFYDFTGYNTITLDDHNYYEVSHYRPRVAEIIAARIFGDTTVAVPPDFGAFVTQANIETRITGLRRQIEQRDESMNKPHPN